MLAQDTTELSDAIATQSSTELARSARIPNLVVIGAMKASTTTFYELITRHPDIWFSTEKEPHYFTSPNYGNPDSWQRYLDLFKSAPVSAKFVGEASTGYSKQPHFGNTPQRLYDDLDNPKLIYLVRDPVERTVSNYQHAYLTSHYAPGTTLGKAIEQDPILIDASCYDRQIEAYLEVFTTEQLLIIPTHQLHADASATMRRVEEFLDLPAYDGWNTPLQQSNSKQSLKGSLTAQSILPRQIIYALRSIIPSGVRGKLKQMVSKPIEVPPITESDRQLAFDRIKDDLNCLRARLGATIDSWPSVQQLGGS